MRSNRLFVICVVASACLAVVFGAEKVRRHRLSKTQQQFAPIGNGFLHAPYPPDNRIMVRMPQVTSAKVFDSPFPKQDLHNSVFSAESCNVPEHAKSAIKQLKHEVKCRPRKTIVHLEHEHAHLSPNAVLVTRCDGACEASVKCRPTKTHNITFVVQQFKDNERTCGRVDIVQHDECTCDCKVRHRDCTPQQVYNPEECKCECPKDVNRNCPQGKKFEQSICGCQCERLKPCTTGSKWDTNMCRCIKIKRKFYAF